MTYTKFTIVVKPEHKHIQELRDLMLDYQLDGGTILRSGDDRLLPFDAAGENAFTQGDYDKLKLVPDIRFEKGMFYYIFTALEIDNLVPVDWPESKDEEGNRLQYQEYFDGAKYKLDDGTCLYRIVRGTNGLSDEHRKIYDESLGGLMVKSEGLALIPAPEEIS